MSVTLRLNGEVLNGRHVRLTEYERLEIEVATSHGRSARPDVLMDGASLGVPEVSITEAGLSWRWIYQSESWCGRTTLSVVTEGAPIYLDIETRPNGSKYSDDQYQVMLNRIIEYGSQLPWGLSPGLSSADEAAGVRLGTTHPVLINHYLRPLLEQLEQLLREPVLSHRRATVVEPLRSSQATSGTINWLASRPSRLRQMRAGDRRVAVPQHRRKATFDHPANRYVVAVLKRLRASFHHTADSLVKYAAGGLLGAQEKNRALHLASETRRAATRLSEALMHPVLRELQPGEMTEGVVQVFADHPAYGRFAKLARRLLDPGLSINDNGGLAASLRRSWDLFEIYSLYRLLEGLEQALGDSWRFERKPIQGHVLSSPAEGKCWHASHPSGLRWELYYQQRFGRADSGPISITTVRYPDFCLALFDGGQLQHWVLLDAKYRTAPESINDALQSMHVYRDSLAWRSPDLRVSRADGGYLLVPAISGTCQRFGREDFLEEWGMGLLLIDDPALGERLVSSLMPRKGVREART
ncbi:MAG: DUF2357 domain-containing protein [Afipia sp.]|nr:DUF2357 domain-containing protein [Afipia sp.]